MAIEKVRKYFREQGIENRIMEFEVSSATADLSAETLQARREWQDTFRVMKYKNLQARLPSKDLIQI